jgi:hypothetical protein
MVDYHSRDLSVPGLAEVIDEMFSISWKSRGKHGVLAEIQRVVNNTVLIHTMRLAVEERATPQARAIALYKLKELKEWLNVNIASARDENQKAHLFYAANQIKLFLENPSEFQIARPLSPPPGAPIGMFDR